MGRWFVTPRRRSRGVTVKTILLNGIPRTTNSNMQCNFTRPWIINYKLLRMCIVYPHEPDRINTTYCSQLYDICGPRIISTLTAIHREYKRAYIYIYIILIFVKLSFINYRYNDFVYRHECYLSLGHWWKLLASCAYTNCKMFWSRGPQWGMRVQNTWLVWNPLSSVYFSLTACFCSCSCQVNRWDQTHESHWNHIIRVCSYTFKVEAVSRCLVRKTHLVWS